MAYASDLCGSKLRAKLSSTLNESCSQKISSNSFAAKQMAKMGWTKGTGLGKKRDGIASHIKVKKREDNIGLGVEKERVRELGVEGMWWSSSVGDTLMKLQSKKKSNKSDKKSKKKKKRKKDKKISKSNKENPTNEAKVFTDEDLFKATGGARFGMRAQRRTEGKWKRTENSAELKEWEQKTEDKMEWNGLGKANVILNEKNSSRSVKKLGKSHSLKKRKRKSYASSDDEEKEQDHLLKEE